MKPKARKYHRLIIAVGSTLLVVSSASAATLTWDNNAAAGVTGGSGNWNTTDTNWTTDGGATRIAWENLSGTPKHDAVITANPTGTATITVSGSISLRNLTINTNATNNSAYTITGASGTLAFTGGTIFFPNSSAFHTISTNISGAPTINTTATGSVARRFDFTAPANGSMVLGNIVSAVHSSADHVSTINLGGGANSTGSLGSSLASNGSGVGNRLYFNSGNWTLNGSAYSRDQWINGATVTIASGGQLRSSTREVLLQAGTLNYNHAGAVRHDNTSFDTGRIFRIIGGTLNNTSGAAITTSTHNPDMAWHGNFAFSGTNGANSNLFLGNGRISLGQGTRTVTVTNAATTLSVGGVISNSGGATPTAGTGALTKAGAGTLELRGANTYTGATTITAGTLSVAVMANGSTASGIGQSTNAAANLVFNGGTLAYTGATQVTNRAFTINADKTATIDVTNGLTLVGHTGTATNGALTKTGAGTLTLSGTNTYTGATAVNAGTLNISSTASTDALSAVTVSNSGSALVVNGTVNGTLLANANTTVSGAGTLASGATISGILAPGNSIGTLTAIGSVTWNSNNAWIFELGNAAADIASANSTPGLSDLLNITGTGSDFLKGSGSSFTFDFAGTGENGFYKLVDWADTTDFLAGDFLATNLAAGKTGSFVVDSGTSALYLNVIPEPSTTVLGGLGLLALLRRRRPTK